MWSSLRCPNVNLKYVTGNDDYQTFYPRHGRKKANWPTIPQLYVKGEFVGGCDIIREMFQASELQGLMQQKGVPVKDRATA
jgi:glutaredoxin-related protein